MREVELQRHLKHPNVVEFHSFFEDDENVYITMENCNRKVKIMESFSGYHISSNIRPGFAF